MIFRSHYYASVELSRVNAKDERFAIYGYTSCRRLEASLNRAGIISPPWLVEAEDDSYIIVDGFKRLAWLKQVRAKETECLVFSAQSDLSQLLLKRIEGKLLGPPLNGAEKAQIVLKLAASFPVSFVAENILPELDISPRNEAVERWSMLAKANESLLEAVASDIISDRAALELASWEVGAAEEMVVLFGSLRCSASIQMEIIDRISGVAKRQNKQKIEILDDGELADIADDPRLNHRQKTQYVREVLTKWSFPRLQAREERFRREVDEASLPPGIRLVPPAAFEGERWQLQVAFSTPGDLCSLLESAEKFAHSPNLSKILSPAGEDR